MIRPFIPDDTDALVAVWREAATLAHPFLPKAFMIEEARLMREVYLPQADTWVAELDGKPVGFIALVDDEIGGLFLHPDHHGQGLGRALVDTAVARRGALTVEVFEANTIGRGFYTAYGFRGSETHVHEPTGRRLLKQRFDPDGKAEDVGGERGTPGR